jgi:hypothetical protein
VDETANRTTLQDQAVTALQSNRNYLAKATTTTTEDKAQIKSLTRQMDGMIRLVLNRLDGTD